MEWTKEALAHYHRLFTDRENRRNNIRHIPAVINWYGEAVEIPGWHDGVSASRVPDEVFNFGNVTPRVAPTKGKAR